MRAEKSEMSDIVRLEEASRGISREKSRERSREESIKSPNTVLNNTRVHSNENRA